MDKNQLYEMFYDEDEAIKIVENGGWSDDGKYSMRTSIFKYNDKFYELCETRSGSYYTDYDYHEPKINEVVPVERVITTTVWTRV